MKDKKDKKCKNKTLVRDSSVATVLGSKNQRTVFKPTFQ
jgi:hypothetical protein